MAVKKKKKKKGSKLIKVLLVIFLLLVLIVGGFALGIYLQLIDTQDANEKLKLYDLPVVGEYFVRPSPPTEEEMEKLPAEDAKPAADKDKKKTDKQENKKIVITKEDIEKQMRQREAEEKKRISKLARLYNQMKPKEAAKAMNELDDDMCIAIFQRMDEAVVAKILTSFDESRTARITRIMFAGNQKEVTTEDDVRRMLEEQAQKQNAEGQTQP
ncbi:Flagellar motility protein MotE, a chaperone for MotC folding [Selenomonas ruminantium]|uniref:Flagellar motility protein MotE, a chaperone for MotC folding n=1 Tax=Selenomonas ruminantium TaxID=971 RepID=A0A1M6RPP2_SELRU|nr:magnesium transporter MgtE [Selenomonas ruminantium]SHK34429.1 Flagellar motility protein MotE, a chaperone for MotC folding [Selenomonas ruminantium]